MLNEKLEELKTKLEILKELGVARYESYSDGGEKIDFFPPHLLGEMELPTSKEKPNEIDIMEQQLSKFKEL